MTDGDLNSSKAKSTGAQGGRGTGWLKTVPLPSSSSGGLPAEVGMEADDESEPSSGDMLSSGGSHQRPTAEGGGLYPGTCHLTGQMLGFRFMVSGFMVHAEEGGPAPQPQQGGGVRWEACAAPAGPLHVCGEKRGVIPVGTKQQSQQPKSHR